MLFSKASPEGLRPQARVGAQPPKAALSAETEAAARRRLMRGGFSAVAPFSGGIPAAELWLPLGGKLPPAGG